MSKASDRDAETLLRGGAFSNPAHKEALRERLFGDMQTLELDDLALVAGGLATDRFQPEDWPEEQKRPGGNV